MREPEAAHHRRRSMHIRHAPLSARITVSAAVLLAFVACTSSVPPSPSPSAPVTTPAPSLSLPISTAADAMAAVVAADPRFADIPPRRLDLIGQSTWWEARPASGVGAFVVQVVVGWGDCQAGCIDSHSWTFAVTPDGGVRQLSEDGPPIPAGVMATDPSTATGITGHTTAGPVCPVETNPPDPACAPRPVADAEIVVRDGSGAVIGSIRSGPDGAFTLPLPPGSYVVAANPVDGLMGTPAPAEVVVVDGSLTVLELGYDTGIR
jgi:hypothetical protein